MKWRILTTLAASTALGAAMMTGTGAATEPRTTLKPLAKVKAGQPMRLKYNVKATAYLLFIPVTGKANFTFDASPDTYALKTKVKTTGIADIFVDYDLHVAATGYVDENGLRPYSFVSQNNDGKKNRRVEMTYGATDVDMTATPEFGNLGFPPATPEQKLDAKDPISALMHFMVHTPADENPCRGPIKTFDGRQLTHLHLEYVKDTNVKTPAYKGEAIECHITLDRVAGYKEGDRGGNLSGIDGPMRMWIGKTADGLHVPVKIVVDTDDIGEITLETRELSFEPLLVASATEG